MARALFQKGQKVWVESVGAWAVVEKVIPVWAKGFEEPVRVTYEIGLGREFQGHELMLAVDDPQVAGSTWRLMRAKNKWQTPDECGHHPFPGTYPVVVTDRADWGGWRVPGAEYDRDPEQIEFQARMIAAAPKLLAIVEALVDAVDQTNGEAPLEFVELARSAKAVANSVNKVLAAPEGSTAAQMTHAA